MRAMLRSYKRQVLKLIDLLLARAQPQGHLAFALSIFDLQAHRRAGLHSGELFVEEAISRFAVDGGDAITGDEARSLRLAALFHVEHFGLTAGVCRGRESWRGKFNRFPDCFQAYKLEEVVVGDFLHSRHVIAEEVGEAVASDCCSRLFDAGGIWKEAVLLGVVIVHPMEQIA